MAKINTVSMGSLANTFNNDTNTVVAKQGQPLFTVESLKETYNPLAQLIRLYCIRKNITKEDLFDMHQKYCMGSDLLSNAIGYDRHNTKKTLMLPDVTFSFTEKFFRIMNSDITNLTITLRNRETGLIEELSVNDVIELVGRNSPYSDRIQECGSLDELLNNEKGGVHGS